MSPPPGSVLSGGMGPGGHQNRAFSPYRHAPTQEDLLNAALRGRALVIPSSPELRAPSVISKSPSKQGTPKSPQSRALSQMEGGRPISEVSRSKHSSVAGSRISHVNSRAEREQDVTPTPSRPQSPDGLDPEEAQMVNDALASRIVDDALAAARTPRTSYYAASLEPEATSHFHDMELCVLLHQENDPSQHEIVKKALRKAVRQRIKKLGMKYDHEVRFDFLWMRIDAHILANSLSKNIGNRTMTMTPASTCGRSIRTMYAIPISFIFSIVLTASFRNRPSGLPI